MKRDPSETRSMILESALREISRKGFSDATIRQIAQNAKVTALTIFRHFTDKENLFASVIKEYSHMNIDGDRINGILSYSNVQEDLDNYFLYLRDIPSLLLKNETVPVVPYSMHDVAPFLSLQKPCLPWQNRMEPQSYQF